MKTLPLFLILFLIGVVFISGCIQTVLDTKSEPATGTSATPMTTATTVPSPLTITLPTPEDPIIGSWVCYDYLASGRLKKVWTFLENNTFILTKTEYSFRSITYKYGTWRRESATTFTIIPSDGGPDTFEYNQADDEFSETHFKERYTRDSGNYGDHAPTMNITLYGAQSVSAIKKAHTDPGTKFLVVNISIKNINETGGYSFDDKSLRAFYDDDHPGALSENNERLGRTLENLFPSGTINVGESRQGNVIFCVPETSHSYTMRLLDRDAAVVSNIIKLDNVPTNTTYIPGLI
jgi:hypothetical protein